MIDTAAQHHPTRRNSTHRESSGWRGFTSISLVIAIPWITLLAACDRTPTPTPVAIPSDAGTVAPACTCVTRSIEWGGTPGLYDAHTYSLKPCNEYSEVSLKWRCVGKAKCDPGAVGGTQGVERVLAHPDVVRALARAPMRFGHARELAEGGDGFRLSVDGREITVYEECGLPAPAGAACELAPAGVLAAKRYLVAHHLDGADTKCRAR